MAARVIFSPRAEADIEAIGDFIALDDRRAADRFVQSLRERCQSLSEFPNRGVPFGKTSRALVLGRYLIFYEVRSLEAGLIVVIAAVVHGARLASRPGD
jgi:toxin ParE1/3/4